MKNTGVLVVFSFALCCFLGVNSNSNDENDESKVSCDKYRIFEDFFACPKIFRPVCGTNGKTYNHECTICQYNRQSGQNIGIKHNKECAEEKYCGTKVSATPMCTLDYNAHCGSNGQTYANKCEFCNAVWKSKEPLTLRSLGTCESTLQES